MVDVSIILLVKNEEKNIKTCLERIYNQKYSGKFEVILADSGSTDKTLEIAKNFPVNVIHIEPKQFRYGFVRNLCAAKSKGNILVYIAGDAYPKDDQWLMNLVCSLNDPKVVGVYGRQIPRKDALPMEQFHIYKFYPKNAIKFTNPNARTINTKGIFFSTVNCAIKKDIWRKHNFSNKLIMHDDLEWARRVLFDGYVVIYNPDAVVVHSHHYTLKTVFVRFFRYGYAMKDTLCSKSAYSNTNFIKDGIEYIFEETSFLLTNKYAKWLPYMVLYDFMKFLGLFVGKELGHFIKKLNSFKK